MILTKEERGGYDGSLGADREADSQTYRKRVIKRFSFSTFDGPIKKIVDFLRCQINQKEPPDHSVSTHLFVHTAKKS